MILLGIQKILERSYVNMIIVRTLGRLGNIFLCVSTALEYCVRNNIDFSNIRVCCDNIKDECYRRILFRFKNIPYPSDIQNYTIVKGHFVYTKFLPNNNIIDNNGTGLHSLKLLNNISNPLNVLFDKVFIKYLHNIDKYRDLFIDYDYLDMIKSKYNFISDSNCLVWNIRHGDISTSQEEIDSVVNNIIYKKYNNHFIYVISNDIDKCKILLSKYNNIDIRYHDIVNPYHDVLLISLCKNLIFAKGTFTRCAFYLSKSIQNVEYIKNKY